MRILLLALLALSGCTSCANKVYNPAAIPEPEPVVAWPIELIGKYSAAHACPVNGFIVTAGHVAYAERIEGGRIVGTPMAYLYSGIDGSKGAAIAGPSNQIVDLALLDLYPPYTGPQHVKGAEPKVGDEVRWVEYDFRKAENAYAPRVRVAKVVNVRVGHILVEPSPVPGASGSCVSNAEGEVVGIVSGGINTEDGKTVGIIVGLDLLPDAQ